MEDCTQVLNDSFLDNYDPPDIGRLKIGSLAVNGVSHDIYKGDNVIGRDELSDIIIRSGAISGKHAVIEVEDWDTHLLYDCGSTNKTRLGKVILKPNVRYNLQGGDDIMFADLKVKYTKLDRPEALPHDDDSGSETGSESMLNCESVDLGLNLEQGEVKELNTNSPKNGPDLDNSGNISDSLANLNDSSVYEEKKGVGSTSNFQVVDATVDESTDDDDDDFFVLPSQTVKEFNSSRHEPSNPNKKVASQSLKKDIFDPAVVVQSHINGPSTSHHTLEINNSKDIFDMETQEQYILPAFIKTPETRNLIDVNSENLFNSEVQVPLHKITSNVTSLPIFEAETQEVEPLLAQNEATEPQTHPNDVFDAETEITDSQLQNIPTEENTSIKEPVVIGNNSVEVKPTSSSSSEDRVIIKEDDMEMSDLVLSSALTEVNTSLQTLQNAGKNLGDVLEETTQANTFTKKYDPKNGVINNDGISNQVENQDNPNISNENLANSENMFKNDEDESFSQQLTQISDKSMSCKKNDEICITNTQENEEDEINLAEELTQVNGNLSKINPEEPSQSVSNALTQFNPRNCMNIDENISKKSDLITQYQSALTQVNDLLKDDKNKISVTKKKTVGDSTGVSPDALTQVSSECRSSLVEAAPSSCASHEVKVNEENDNDVTIEKEENNFVAEETQLNINLVDKEINYTVKNVAHLACNQPAEKIENIEFEETQLNLNLFKQVESSRRKVKKDIDDIAEAETQARGDQTDDSDSTDVDDDTNMDKVEVFLKGQKRNKSPVEHFSVERNKKRIRSDNFEMDENSNASDSLLASMPVDVDNIDNSGEQQLISIHNNSCKVENQEIKVYPVVNKTKDVGSFKPSQDEGNDNFRKDDHEVTTTKSTLTVADMEICSTVGDTMHISTLSTGGSSRKTCSVIKFETKKTPSQSVQGSSWALPVKTSSKLIEHRIPPLVEEEVSKNCNKRSKKLFEDHENTSNNGLDQSLCLDEPCSSSTPFNSDKFKNFNQIENLPLKPDVFKTPTKKIAKSLEASPLLPCSEELLAVADKTPEGIHETSLNSGKRKKDMLPLALKRTPRVKKLSRKMAEHFELLEEDSIEVVEKGKSNHNLDKTDESKDVYKKVELKGVSVKIEKHCDPIHISQEKNMEVENLKSKKSLKQKVKNVENQGVAASKIKGGSPSSEEINKIENKTKISSKNKKEKQQDTLSNDICKLETVSKDCTKPLSLSILKMDVKECKRSPPKRRRHNQEEETSYLENSLEKTETKQRTTRRGKVLDSLESEDINGAEQSTKIKNNKHKSSRVRNNSKQKKSSNVLTEPNKKVSSTNMYEESKQTSCSKQKLVSNNADSDTKECVVVLSCVTTEEKNKSLNQRKSEKSVVSEKVMALNDSKKLSSKDFKEMASNIEIPNQYKKPQANNKFRSTRSKAINLPPDQTGEVKSDNETNDVKSTALKTTKRNHSTETSPDKRKSSRKLSPRNGSAERNVATDKTEISPHRLVDTNVSEESNESFIKSWRLVSSLEVTTKSSKSSKSKEDEAKKRNQAENKRTRKQSNVTRKDNQILTNEDVLKTDNTNYSKGKFSPKIETKTNTQTKKESHKCTKKSQDSGVDGTSPRPSRRGNQSKKEKCQNEAKEPLREHDSLIELKTTLQARNKRKCVDDSLEEIGSAKNSKLSVQVYNKSKSKIKQEDGSNKKGNNDLSDSIFESKGRRAKLIPARFRENEDNIMSDSSVSEKDSLSSRRQKTSDILGSMESIDSMTLEEGKKKNSNNDESAFVVPSKSDSRQKGKQSAITKADVSNSKGRSRSKTNDIDERSRSRSGSFSSQSSLRSPSTPRRSVKKGEQVLFTGLSNPALEANIKKLGGMVVDCSTSCSVLVTDKVRRTVKFLCVLGQGKPIVTPEWITQSYRCSSFEDPMNYLLEDTEAEQKFSFTLRQTLEQAKKQPLLRGYSLLVTPSVKPPPDDIKSIVESCGGVFLSKTPAQWPEQSVVISHPEDKTLWKKLKVKGSTPPIVVAEMLLLGVLQHKLDIKTHRIS